MGLMRFVAIVGLALAFTSAHAQAQEQAPTVVVVDKAAPPVGGVLHLEVSDPRAHVQALNEHQEWVTVCEAPCDQALDSRLEYRVAGKGLRATTRFQVPPAGTFALRADMRPTKNVIFGAVFTGVGGLTLLSAVVLFALSGFERAKADLATTSAHDADAERLGAKVLNIEGIIFAVIGVGLFIPGVVFLSGGTKSTLLVGTPVAKLQWVPGGLAF